jgi:ubiquinone/menaquinone biosynthesis C-methylase UbiE
MGGIMPAMTDSAEKAAFTYNAASDHFDDEPLGFWSRHGQRTIERLALAPGARVLDAGCGTGASAIPAAERVGPTGHVTGIDVAERQLEIARRKAEAKGLRNIAFRVGDMRQLDYPDATFDAVVCVFAIFFADDMVAQVKELWRLVRPGGRLAITTWGPRVLEPAASGWRESVRALRPDLVSAFNPWDRITDPEALRDLLSEAGVPQAEITPESGWQKLRSAEDWWRVALGSGYRWTIEQMGPETAAEARRMNLDWIRSHRIEAIETNGLFAVASKPNSAAG